MYLHRPPLPFFPPRHRPSSVRVGGARGNRVGNRYARSYRYNRCGYWDMWFCWYWGTWYGPYSYGGGWGMWGYPYGMGGYGGYGGGGMGGSNSCGNCNGCDCNGCGSCDTGDCKGGNGGGAVLGVLLIIVVVIVLAIALLGAVVGVAIAVVVVQRIAATHAHVLKRALAAKDYRVADLSSEDVDAIAGNAPVALAQSVPVSSSGGGYEGVSCAAPEPMVFAVEPMATAMATPVVAPASSYGGGDLEGDDQRTVSIARLQSQQQQIRQSLLQMGIKS